MSPPPPALATPRLRLRPPRPDDAEAIFTGYARDPEVTRYLTWRPHRSLDDTRRFLTDCLAACERGTELTWVIERRHDDRLLGTIGVRPAPHRMELGYVLTRAYWGQGFMPEAVRALVDWALEQPDIYRAWAVCDVENARSARVLEKAGLQREGLLRRWSVHPALGPAPRDCWCYARVR